MTLKALRDLLDSLCDESDEKEINGHIILKNVSQHGAELHHLVRTYRDGKSDGYTHWPICNIGWTTPKEPTK